MEVATADQASSMCCGIVERQHGARAFAGARATGPDIDPARRIPDADPRGRVDDGWPVFPLFEGDVRRVENPSITQRGIAATKIAGHERRRHAPLCDRRVLDPSDVALRRAGRRASRPRGSALGSAPHGSRSRKCSGTMLTLDDAAAHARGLVSRRHLHEVGHFACRSHSRPIRTRPWRRHWLPAPGCSKRPVPSSSRSKSAAPWKTGSAPVRPLTTGKIVTCTRSTRPAAISARSIDRLPCRSNDRRTPP